MKIIRAIFCIHKATSKQDTKLMGYKMECVEIMEPDEIIWENLSFSGDDQMIRKTVLYVVSLVFLACVTIFTMYMGGAEALIKQEVLTIECPNSVIEARDAYLDEITAPTGVIACFCDQVPLADLFTHSFLEEQKALIDEGLLPANSVEDDKNYCLPEVLRVEGKALALTAVTTSAVMVNGVISDFFTYFGKYEKKHTIME